MPKFVPVTDTEKPRSEQSNDATMARHRQFDNPHSVNKDKVDRGWVQGEVGWGVLKNFGDDERDAKAQILRHAEGANKMVKNDKGLWVKAKEVADNVDDHHDGGGQKGMGRGSCGIPVVPYSNLTADEDNNNEKRCRDARIDDEDDYRSRKTDCNKRKHRQYDRDERRERSRSPADRRRNDSRDRRRYRDDSRDRSRHRHQDSCSPSRSLPSSSYRDREKDRPRSRKDSRSPERRRSGSRDRYHDRSTSRRDDYEKDGKEQRRRASRFDSRPTRDISSSPPLASRAQDEDQNEKEEEEAGISPLKITAIQVINHFHDIYSNKSISSDRRMKELDTLFSSTAKIMSLKTSSAYLSSKEQILSSFTKTNPTVVTVSKRIYIEKDGQDMTFCLDLHRAATSPGLGDGRKENVLLYACEASKIIDVWGMVDSEHLAADTELTMEQVVTSKFWPFVSQIVQSKWKGGEELDVTKLVHYHNYDHMEVWGM